MRERQRQIIEELGVKSVIDPAEEIERRTQFLVEHLADTGIKGYVLGISGGQDSLLAGIITQKAVDIHRQTKDDVAFHAVLLPYGEQADRQDALLACEVIRPDYTHDIDIKPAVDASAKSAEITLCHPVSDFTKANIKARERMVAQYLLANEYHLGVVGTDHAAEAVTGFYTKFGDGAADVMPLAGLTKHQGREMLAYLGVPSVFITKPPIADLSEEYPGRTDEEELGITYDTLDNYLIGEEVTEADAINIETRFEKTAHKRAMPKTPK